MILQFTFLRVPLTRVSKRHTTGWLTNFLTFFTPHTESKRNRLLKTGVSIVGTLNLEVTYKMWWGPLVLDLHIDHERWGNSTDPTLNGHLHYPNDLDKPLNESGTDKIRKYHSDRETDRFFTSSRVQFV